MSFWRLVFAIALGSIVAGIIVAILSGVVGAAIGPGK